MVGPERALFPPSPFASFNFDVRITLLNQGAVEDAEPLVHAAFSDCDGLEVSLEVKTLRSGGDNGRQVRLPGALSFGNVTLKRGMTPSSHGLWRWVLGYAGAMGVRRRAMVEIRSISPTRVPLPEEEVQVAWVLRGALPVKLKAPAMNAKDGVVAVEELQLTFETLDVIFPGQATLSARAGGAP